MLRGEIATLDHYHPLGGKTKGQGWHLINSQKELPSLTYFITATQIVSKKSYKKNKGLLFKTNPALINNLILPGSRE